MRALALIFALALSACAGGRSETSVEDARAADVAAMRAATADATFANSAGRFSESEELLRHALDLCGLIFSAADPDCADLRARLAVELLNIRKPGETQTQLDAARDLASDATGAFVQPRIQTLEALTLGRKGQYQDAYDLALDAGYARRDAIATLGQRSTGGEYERQLYLQGIHDAAHGFLVAAGMAYRLEDFPKARAAGLVARNMMLTLRNRPPGWISLIDSMIASADAQMGQLELAEERQQLAVTSRRIEVGESVATAFAVLRLTDVQSDADKNDEAIANGRKALELLRTEAVRGGFQGVDAEDIAGFLRASWRSAESDPALAFERHEHMFEAAQMVYGGSAAETLRKLAGRLAADTPALGALAEELESARVERDRLRISLSRNMALVQSDPDRFEDLRDEAIAAANRLRAAEEALTTGFPDYVELTSATPVTADAVGRVLGGGEALLTFSIGPESGFAFLVTGGVVSAAPVPIGEAALAEAVRRLREAFLIQPGGGILPFDMGEAHALYRTLIGELAFALDQVDHLIVAPVGPLMSFPFAALVDQSPGALGQEDYVRASWFGSDRAISYAPSVKAFVNLRRFSSPSRASRAFIGFGDPTFTGGGGLKALGDHCQTDGPTPPELIRGLTPLPGTRDEMVSVAQSIGGAPDLFLGGQATEEAVRNADLRDYRVVYFATHGLLPGELRCQAEPGLALTAPRFAASRAEDGLLTAGEVAQLRLDADLVVLSACNTGGGAEGDLGGEALSGLASAFFLAGARSLIVSHWQVESRATTDLMSDAFRRLGLAGGSAEALRAAQADIAAEPERAHPFFWAAFTVIGDGQPRAVPASL